MIRRGFWLAAGVVLGVTGYRRVTRLANALTVPRAPGVRSLAGTAPTAGPQMLAPSAPRRSNVARVVAAARFVQDVRDGMAEYRHMRRDEPDPAPTGRTLEGQGDAAAAAGAVLSSEPAGSGASEQGRREP